MTGDRDCFTCFYSETKDWAEPCGTCSITGKGYSNWVAMDFLAKVSDKSPVLEYKPEDVAFNKRALDVQVSGNHYKDLAIQPVEYIHANDIGYFEGNVIKYVSRWRNKNGIKDLEKAKHYIELLIELEEGK